jgi:hypothetical protein
MDVGLYLDYSWNKGGNWDKFASSTSTSNTESIDYSDVISSYYYRWRIHVNSSSYSGQSIELLFSTNVGSAYTFTSLGTTTIPSDSLHSYALPLIIACSIGTVVVLVVSFYYCCAFLYSRKTPTVNVRIDEQNQKDVGDQEIKRLLP